MSEAPNNLLAAPTTRDEALAYIEALNKQFDIEHPEDVYLNTINAMQKAFDDRQTALLEQVVGAVLHVTGKMHLRLDITDLMDRKPFKVTSTADGNVVTYSLLRDNPTTTIYEVHAGEIKAIKAIGEIKAIKAIGETTLAYRLADGGLRYKKKASVIVKPSGTYYTADLETAREWAELMQNEMS
jgi:hypothetical protein